MSEEQTQIGFRVSRRLKARVERIAKREGQTMQALMIKLLEIFSTQYGHKSVSLLQIEYRLDRIESMLEKSLVDNKRHLRNIQDQRVGINLLKNKIPAIEPNPEGGWSYIED